MKIEKQIEQFIYRHGPEWPPSDAAAFVEWLQFWLNAMPPECRASARIVIDSEHEYDSTRPFIHLSYVRLETDDEEAERLRAVAGRAERQRAEELRMLAQLRAKYGDQA